MESGDFLEKENWGPRWLKLGEGSCMGIESKNREHCKGHSGKESSFCDKPVIRDEWEDGGKERLQIFSTGR